MSIIQQAFNTSAVPATNNYPQNSKVQKNGNDDITANKGNGEMSPSEKKNILSERLNGISKERESLGASPNKTAEALDKKLEMEVKYEGFIYSCLLIFEEKKMFAVTSSLGSNSITRVIDVDNKSNE